MTEGKVIDLATVIGVYPLCNVDCQVELTHFYVEC